MSRGSTRDACRGGGQQAGIRRAAEGAELERERCPRGPISAPFVCPLPIADSPSHGAASSRRGLFLCSSYLHCVHNNGETGSSDHHQKADESVKLPKPRAKSNHPVNTCDGPAIRQTLYQPITSPCGRARDSTLIVPGVFGTLHLDPQAWKFSRCLLTQDFRIIRCIGSAHRFPPPNDQLTDPATTRKPNH